MKYDKALIINQSAQAVLRQTNQQRLKAIGLMKLNGGFRVWKTLSILAWKTIIILLLTLCLRELGNRWVKKKKDRFWKDWTMIPIDLQLRTSFCVDQHFEVL